MPAVSDPAIFLSIFLRRDAANSANDGYIQVLHGLDAFINKYGLEPDAQTHRRCSRAADIDLIGLAKAPPSFNVLLQCHTEYPKSVRGTYYECLAYTYLDALIFQLMVTKFRDWRGPFRAGWDELADSLRSCFDGIAFADASRTTLGISAVYWAIDSSHSEIGVQKQLFCSIAEAEDLGHTDTDLGAPLWRCERPVFPGCAGIPQDLWMLIAPRSAEAEVNARFYQPRMDSPPDFAIAALARHKIAYERDEYGRERDGMGQIENELDRRVAEIVDSQRRFGSELEELRSDNALDFQRKLAQAGALLADYGQSIGLLKQLRRTVLVNVSNFLIHSVPLISSHGAEEVALSVDQETAAARALARVHRDEIFCREISAFHFLSREVDSTIDYASSTSERHALSLRSAGDHLRIAGERELGEIAHHLSIDSAAVVASVVAVIASEIIIRPAETQPAEEAIGSWLLALALVVGSFALTQALSSGFRGRHLERWSVAVAVGLLGAFVANRYLATQFPTHLLPVLARVRLYHLHELVALALGMLLGWFGHRGFKRYRSSSVRRVLPNGGSKAC
jgi:hypothetical protein